MMDYEKALAVKHSSVWTAVVDELEYRVDAELAKLCDCKAEQCASIQDKIRLYRELQRLPDDVLDRETPGSDSPVNEFVKNQGRT